MKIKVYLLFGSEECSIFENRGIEEVLDKVQCFEFNTKKEAQAFLLGVEAATGYLESLVIDNEYYESLTKNLE